MTLYFNPYYLGEPNNEFVAWVDVMGIQNQMVRSIKSTANFVYKTHAAVLEALNVAHQVTVYPVMDGFYASTDDVGHLKRFLIRVFSEIVTEFVKDQPIYYSFVIRGGIAFGTVYHGRSLEREASFILNDNPAYRNMLMLGESMINAHLIEKHAPPYGFAIHESAENFTEGKIDLVSGNTWWPWYKGVDEIIPVQMNDKLKYYFNWCHVAFTEGYSQDKRDEHNALSERFFSM